MHDINFDSISEQHVHLGVGCTEFNHKMDITDVTTSSGLQVVFILEARIVIEVERVDHAESYGRTQIVIETAVPEKISKTS